MPRDPIPLHDHGQLDEAVSRIINLSDRPAILNFTTVFPRHRDYGVWKILEDGEVHLRTPRQVASFCHFILASPEKRGCLIDTLRIVLPAFEDPEDAERLAATIPWLRKLRDLSLDEPEAGLAAHPRLIDAFRPLRCIRILRIADADGYSYWLLDRLKSGLKTLHIRHRDKPQSWRGFSMSNVLWRQAYSLESLLVDDGFATHFLDDYYAPFQDRLPCSGQELQYDEYSDAASESAETDVDSVFVPDVEDPSGYSSGYSSDTHFDEENVLDDRVLEKLLNTGGRFDSEGMDELPVSEDPEIDDVARGLESQGNAGEPVADAAREGERDNDREQVDDSDEDTDAQSAVSDLDDVEWVGEVEGLLAVFPALKRLTVPNLCRETFDHILLAAPSLTWLDIGATCKKWTQNLQQIRAANERAMVEWFDPDAPRGTEDWSTLTVRGGLLDLAVLGNSTRVTAVEVMGVIHRYHWLLPVVVFDNRPTVLRVTVPLPFKVGKISGPAYAEEMAGVKALTLRAVVKRNTPPRALKECLLRVLNAFRGLRRLIVNLTYDEHNVDAAGCLDDLDFTQLADSIREKVTLTPDRVLLKRLCLKHGSRVEHWKVVKSTRFGEVNWHLNEVSPATGRSLMEKKGMLSRAFPL